jgi:DNA-binding CsgD family transcriptional regulator
VDRASAGVDGVDFVARERELRRVVTVLTDSVAGALVVAGPAGVGKTRLAGEAATILAASGSTVLRVVATTASASIPFGPFASLLPGIDVPSADRLAWLRHAASMFAARADSGPVLLVVDDAHLLDDGSAALVHHLVETGSCRMVLTVRTGHQTPDSITGLWKDGLADRLDLAPFDLAATEAVVVAMLGGPIAGPSLRWLYEQAVGNPLHLRELLTAASESGALSQSGGIWVLRVPMAVPERLFDLVASRLAELPPKAVEVVELLAVGEPLDFALLERICGLEAVEFVESHGLLIVRGEQDSLVAGLHHPLYGEVLRQRMPRTTFRRLSGMLADAVEETSGAGDDVALRVATWRLDAGMPISPDLLGRAARSARWRFDNVLAARLARAALARGGGAAAALALGEAEFYSGRHAEAEAALASAVDLCRDDTERAAIASARAYNLGMLIGDAQGAAAVITEALRVIRESGPRLRLVARQALNNVYAGDIESALADSDELIASNDDDAATRGATIRSVALAAMGRGDAAVEAAYQGVESAKRTAQTQESQLVGSIFGHAASGRFDRAEADGRSAYEICVRAGNAEGAATFGLLLGWVLVEEGDCAGGSRMFREAAAGSRDLRDVPNLRWSLGGLALAEGMGGNARPAAAALAELDELPPHWMVLFDPDLIERGRAWTKVAEGEISAATTRLREAADRAAQQHCWLAEAKLRHDLIRLGELGTEVARLAELAGLLEGPLAQTFALHADAVSRRDARSLQAAAEGFASLGANLLAAEAFTAAGTGFERDGLKRLAAAAARRVAELRAVDGLGLTPALVTRASLVPLTKREREVAVLASAGLSSREIADRLYVSVRTVDNQLQRVYGKLGISGREALPHALEQASPSP